MTCRESTESCVNTDTEVVLFLASVTLLWSTRTGNTRNFGTHYDDIIVTHLSWLNAIPCQARTQS